MPLVERQSGAAAVGNEGAARSQHHSAPVESIPSRTKSRKIQFDKNNIDCLRLILASMVALFHIGALTGIGVLSMLGKSSADFAVKGFFVISGMLVYRSYLRSSSLRSYIEKRARRIYPGYLTVVLICAFGLYFLSTASFSQYFGWAFWKYLAVNSVFLTHLCPSLPGVFQSHIETAVDGVFWTLKIEVLFYLCVPVICFVLKRIGQVKGLAIFFVLSGLWRLLFDYLGARQTQYYPKGHFYHELAVQFPGQLLYFVAGIFILLYFDKLTSLMPWIFALTIAAFLFDHFISKGAIDCVWISAFVLVSCFWRHLGNFAKYGDFSYGVYIVHWPILQIMISFGLDKLHPALFLAIALSAIFITAALLWHLVESKWLARGSHYRLGAKKA
jgi:peptidoglycan/LPS O-acetylase OafA/YrhL